MSECGCCDCGECQCAVEEAKGVLRRQRLRKLALVTGAVIFYAVFILGWIWVMRLEVYVPVR